ncbi:MAG TPA: hypothetical protein VHB27_23315 [Rhodopila sp.]|uniref:hypothetical protein n=1 Tax=Rhodopila sp. TaxID=2480087 RepID=UPI002CB0E376|nr:hypothetical protein [Rhodopila sp.]HVY18168.1 hypothetical protein [Rhodopila sp.]
MAAIQVVDRQMGRPGACLFLLSNEIDSLGMRPEPAAGAAPASMRRHGVNRAGDYAML